MFGYFKKKAKTNDEPDELKHMVDYANYTDMKNMKDDVGVTHELREALQTKLKK